MPVHICLEEVELCRPFFLCLLGERYGFIPQALPRETIERFPWLTEYADRSVTELEILHGALLQPEKLGTVFFYFRDRTYLDRIGEDERRQNFEAEGPLAKEMLTDLKHRIRQSEYPVKRYAEPAALGDLLLDDMRCMIE